MNDLTILFYSANKVEEPFASRVRSHLLETIGDTPLISISHEPMDFGRNFVIDPSPVSTYTLYRQLLIGARMAETPFVACAEDDSLYTPSHFSLRPPDGETFGYDQNRWWCEPDGRFRWRDRVCLNACVAPRRLLIDTLERRFEKFPTHPERREGLNGWGEMGRYEWYLKLPKVKMASLWGAEPIVTFNRKGSLGGVRRTNPSDIIKTELGPWGRASDIWERFHGTVRAVGADTVA